MVLRRIMYPSPPWLLDAWGVMLLLISSTTTWKITIERWDETGVGGEKGRDVEDSARACGLVDSPSSFKLKISGDRLTTHVRLPHSTVDLLCAAVKSAPS